MSGMAPTYKGQLPAGKVVLGLLIARPNATASLIAQLMGERFDFARFLPSAAYNELKRFVEHGQAVRTYEDPDPGRDALDRYEATPEGEREFVEWLHATTVAPLLLREAVYGRVMLGEPDDLPIIIRGICNEERVCQREFRACRKSLEGIEAGIHNATDWRYEARAAVMDDMGLVWLSRLRRLARLRRNLQRIYDKHVAEDSGG
jgi:DNA-binding PadR family transcriptional regulator